MQVFGEFKFFTCLLNSFFRIPIVDQIRLLIATDAFKNTTKRDISTICTYEYEIRLTGWHGEMQSTE